MVQIKPLEWEEIHYNRSNEEPIPELTGWYAETEVGSYYVMLEARIEVTLDGFQFHKVGSFDEPDAAFAAAQADYERRILSALVPSTLAESRCENAEAELADMTKDYLRRHNDAVDNMERALVAESRCEELVKALKDRDEEIARYQGLLDAAIDDYNNARNTALGEAAKVAYDYECSLADYGDSVDAKHFYEGGVGDASIGISKAIRSLIQERKASDDLKEAEGLRDRCEKLEKAASAVIAQWDTPNWKLTEPTAKLIEEMRSLIQKQKEG